MKNYLVIGGSSGIGLAIVEQLSTAGHQVWATYNKNQPATTSQANFQQLDVLHKEAQLNDLPEVLDGFVYCPGSINLLPFTRIKPADFIQDFELQVVGAIRLLQQVIPNLKASEEASVVFFSTVAVQVGFNYHTQVATSKGAIEGLTKALAAEYSPSIRVNAIAPSLTDTPLANNLLNTDQKKDANAKRHPLQRIGEANDLAEMAAFLLSDKSSWMTGQILHVDGGISTLKK